MFLPQVDLMRMLTRALSLFAVFSLVSVNLLASDDQDASLRGESHSAKAQRVLDSLHEPSGWSAHRRSAREGVDVFKKDLAGFDILAFRGEKVVAASSDVLFDLLVDFRAHVGMSERVPLALSDVLKQQGNVVEFFQLVDTPGWTMARDRGVREAAAELWVITDHSKCLSITKRVEKVLQASLGGSCHWC